MSKFKHFLGIDISKEYFDAVVILKEQNEHFHNQFPNDYKGIRAMITWLKSHGATKENTLVCMEHTGMYGKILIKYLLAFQFSLWVEMSIKIIKKSGLQRGKNDKIDAKRIAQYAMNNQQEVQLYIAPRRVVEKIKVLLGLREKLVVTKATLTRNAKEYAGFDKELSKMITKHQNCSIKGIEKDLAKIDKQLSDLVEQDVELNELYQQATSVPGIGKITTLFLLCFTNEFKMYQNSRQLACYCGVVPFEHTSGKSVKKKSRVHFMANKKLKKQLHLCALVAIQHEPELKAYYNRKVAEGKNKMLVLNNVRNKLVQRICACVKEKRVFEKRIVA